MKQIIAVPLVALSVALPVPTLVPNSVKAEEEKEGFSLVEEGARLFFRGLMQEMEPALDDFETMLDEMQPALRNFAVEMGPKLQALLDEVEDWSAYEAPEVLPNGDIIIRRKARPEGEIEL